MIREALIYRLKQVSEVVSSGITAGNKVFWLRFGDPKQAPALTFALAGGSPDDPTTCGSPASGTADFDVYAWSRNGCEAATIIEAIISEMHGAAWTADSTQVTLCEVVERLEDHWEREPFLMAGAGISLRLYFRPSA